MGGAGAYLKKTEKVALHEVPNVYMWLVVLADFRAVG